MCVNVIVLCLFVSGKQVGVQRVWLGVAWSED